MVADPSGRGGGADFAVGVDVAHHVVAQLLLLGLGIGKVDIVQVRSQLVQLGLGDGQPEGALLGGQGEPEAAPGGELFLG